MTYNLSLISLYSRLEREFLLLSSYVLSLNALFRVFSRANGKTDGTEKTGYRQEPIAVFGRCYTIAPLTSPRPDSARGAGHLRCRFPITCVRYRSFSRVDISTDPRVARITSHHTSTATG